MTPKPPKVKPPGSGVPGDFAAFAAEREAAREVRRKQLAGGQLIAAEHFTADPREGPEVVRLGRIPGGRGIRRL